MGQIAHTVAFAGDWHKNSNVIERPFNDHGLGWSMGIVMGRWNPSSSIANAAVRQEHRYEIRSS